MSLDKEIFKGKKFSNLLEEIYDNSRKKDTQISALIAELKPLIESISDATLVVPMIKEYLEIGVKNDEHLIKLATVIQRMESAAAKGSSEEDFFNPEELQALLESVEELEVPTEDNEEEGE
jgi:hypothetical protein